MLQVLWKCPKNYKKTAFFDFRDFNLSEALYLLGSQKILSHDSQYKWKHFFDTSDFRAVFGPFCTEPKGFLSKPWNPPSTTLPFPSAFTSRISD